MFKGKGIMNDFFDLYVVNFVFIIFVNFVGIFENIIVLFCLSKYENKCYEWIVDIGIFDYMIFYLYFLIFFKILIKFIYIILFDGNFKFVSVVGKIVINN